MEDEGVKRPSLSCWLPFCVCFLSLAKPSHDANVLCREAFLPPLGDFRNHTSRVRTDTVAKGNVLLMSSFSNKNQTALFLLRYHMMIQMQRLSTMDRKCYAAQYRPQGLLFISFFLSSLLMIHVCKQIVY